MSETPNEGADVCMIYLKGLKININLLHLNFPFASCGCHLPYLLPVLHIR